MQNGQFTEEEIEYLSSLDAVEGVRQNQIIYSNEFKKDFIEKYKQGKNLERYLKKLDFQEQ